MPFLTLILAFALGHPIIAAAPEPEPQAIVTVSIPEPVIVKPIPEPNITHREETCNCYNLLKKYFSDRPFMDDILKMAGPAFGNVAVFKYPATDEFPDGTPHVAVTTGNMGIGTFEIEEYNYHECKRSTRMVSFTDKYLIGFVTLR